MGVVCSMKLVRKTPKLLYGVFVPVIIVSFLVSCGNGLGKFISEDIGNEEICEKIDDEKPTLVQFLFAQSMT